jgi:hypothetical protein
MCNVGNVLPKVFFRIQCANSTKIFQLWWTLHSCDYKIESSYPTHRRLIPFSVKQVGISSKLNIMRTKENKKTSTKMKTIYSPGINDTFCSNRISTIARSWQWMIAAKVPSALHKYCPTVKLDVDRSTIVIRSRILQTNQSSWYMCWTAEVYFKIFNILSSATTKNKSNTLRYT